MNKEALAISHLTSIAPSSRWRWLVLGWCTAFSVGVDLFVVAPLLPAIAAESAKSATDLVILITAFGVTYAAACLVQGMVAERIGARRVLLAGLTVLGAANLFTAIATDVPQLVAARILAGIGAASTTPMVYALTAERAPANRRAFDLSLVNSGLVLALVFGAPLGMLWGSWSGWREIFALLGVLFFVLLPVHFVFADTARVKSPVAAVNPGPFMAVGILVLAGTICWSAGVYASYTLLVTSLQAAHVASGEIAGVLAVFGIGATAGGVLGGRLADRWGNKRFLLRTLTLMVASLALASLVSMSGVVWGLALALGLAALFSYGFFPAMQAYASAALPARRKAVLGLMSSSLYGGIAVGSALGAWVYSRVGFSFVLVLSTLFALCTLVLVQRLPRLDQ